MLKWLPTLLLAKQAVEVVAIRPNALSLWYTVPSGYSIILGVDPLAPVNIDYIPV